MCGLRFRVWGRVTSSMKKDTCEKDDLCILSLTGAI